MVYIAVARSATSRASVSAIPLTSAMSPNGVLCATIVTLPAAPTTLLETLRSASRTDGLRFCGMMLLPPVYSFDTVSPGAGDGVLGHQVGAEAPDTDRGRREHLREFDLGVGRGDTDAVVGVLARVGEAEQVGEPPAVEGEPRRRQGARTQGALVDPRVRLPAADGSRARARRPGPGGSGRGRSAAPAPRACTTRSRRCRARRRGSAGSSCVDEAVRALEEGMLQPQPFAGGADVVAASAEMEVRRLRADRFHQCRLEREVVAGVIRASRLDDGERVGEACDQAGVEESVPRPA